MEYTYRHVTLNALLVASFIPTIMILLNSKTCCVFTGDMSKLFVFAILTLFQVVGSDTVESTGQVLLAKLYFSCFVMCNLKFYICLILSIYKNNILANSILLY